MLRCCSVVPDGTRYSPRVAPDGTALRLPEKTRAALENNLVRTTSTPGVAHKLEKTKLGSSFRLARKTAPVPSVGGPAAVAARMSGDHEIDDMDGEVQLALASLLDGSGVDIAAVESPVSMRDKASPPALDAASPASPSARPTPRPGDNNQNASMKEHRVRMTEYPLPSASQTMETSGMPMLASAMSLGSSMHLDIDTGGLQAEKVDPQSLLFRGINSQSPRKTQTLVADMVPKTTHQENMKNMRRLTQFLSGYGSEGTDAKTFASAAVFCEVKLRELHDLRRAFNDPYPNPFHTAVRTTIELKKSAISMWGSAGCPSPPRH